jgi:XTP/dITP diphosphohydrolase
VTLRLLVGTGNPGKAAEFERMLAGLDLELVRPGDLDPVPDEPAEDGANYAENATNKARAYATATGLAAIADDSGLEVEALGGAPGTRSRRYFGEDVDAAERNRRLLELLRDTEHRGARFVCVIALALPGVEIELFEGEVRGEIARQPSGAEGFGYDPLFIIRGDGRTMAELNADEKDRLSHRGLAAAKLRARLAVR